MRSPAPWLWVRSLALEKPLWHLARPAISNIASAALAGIGCRAPSRTERLTRSSAPPRVRQSRASAVEAAPRQPITIQSPITNAVTKAFAPVSGQNDLFGNNDLPSA